MKRKFYKSGFALFILFTLVFSSCNKKTCKKAICTSIFKMVMVQVVDSENAPVELDEFYTIRNRTGEKIITENNMGEGRYNVLDDSFHRKIINSTEDFTFIGIKDGQQVINEPYIISADCCHINKESGREIIAI